MAPSRALMLAGQVPQRDLPALMTALPFRPQFAMAFRPAAAVFCRYDQLGAVGDWEEGQVFDATAELRWRREKAAVALLLTGELTQAGLPAFFDNDSCLDLADYLAEEHSFYLWGRAGQDGSFGEGRIPRLWTYPVDRKNGGEGRALVKAVLYHSPKSQQVEFWRLCGVEVR